MIDYSCTNVGKKCVWYFGDHVESPMDWLDSKVIHPVLPQCWHGPILEASFLHVKPSFHSVSCTLHHHLSPPRNQIPIGTAIPHWGSQCCLAVTPRLGPSPRCLTPCIRALRPGHWGWVWMGTQWENPRVWGTHSALKKFRYAIIVFCFFIVFFCLQVLRVVTVAYLVIQQIFTIGKKKASKLKGTSQ